ncbi:hypothetical protein, partial [Burkholderia sp. AU38729]|uniref:hypothetical protein n=1 Tax=Burkholderia sp. AU38729 TaxID=2879633 RepID=UPI001CF1AAD3
FRRRPSTLRNAQNEEKDAAKTTLKPDIFKWLEGGHLNPGMTLVVRAKLKCPLRTRAPTPVSSLV